MFDHIETFHRPTSVPDALLLLQRCKGRARILAGGTDLVLACDRSVNCLIDITHAGLGYIRKQGRGVVVGAATRLADLEENVLILGLAGGILARAAATCGSIQNRNMATLGGNLANASPAADIAVPLLALDASVVMEDTRGRNTLPLADYLASVHSSKFARSLMVEIGIPAPPAAPRSGWSFQKLGRTAVDISVVNVAAGVGMDGKGRVRWARLALGAVAPTVMRAADAERLMVDRPLDRALIAGVAAAVERSVDPISDVRASAGYRREMSAVLTARALEECAAQTGVSL